MIDPNRALSPLEAINSSRAGLALLGEAGSGKTTILRSLAVESARGTIIRGSKRIPLYLQVRDLASTKSGILESGAKLFDFLEISESNKVLQFLLRSDKLLLLLDGLDETLSDHQVQLLNELIDIRAKYPGNVFCVSSRPLSMAIGIPGFDKWDTLPMQVESRKLFIKKWFSMVDHQKGEQLISYCNKQPEVLSLGSNPLLLSILCALYNNDLHIPTEYDELYSRCVEGIMGRWDSFRNIARASIIGHLPIRKRIILVTWIAAALFQCNKIVFSAKDLEETDVLNRIAAAMRTKIPSAECLLASLYNDFGILIERAPGLYSFSHLTLHEYLVAQYIIDNRREDIVIQQCRDKLDYYFIIAMVAKMLPSADNFLRLLMKKLSLLIPRHSKLMMDIWKYKPVCGKDVTNEFTAYAVDALRTLDSLITVDMMFNIDNSILNINLFDKYGLLRIQEIQKEVFSYVQNELDGDQSESSALAAKGHILDEVGKIAYYLFESLFFVGPMFKDINLETHKLKAYNFGLLKKYQEWISIRCHVSHSSYSISMPAELDFGL